RLFAVLAAERTMARVLLRESFGVDEEFDRKVADFYERVAALIERGLRLGIEMGLVRRCDPSLIAWGVLGSVKEVADRVFVRGSGAAPDLEAIGRELLDFNLRGVFASHL